MVQTLRARRCRKRAFLVLSFTALACQPDDPAPPVAPDAALSKSNSPSVIAQGREIFRFDTFGNETFWTDTAGLHTVINALAPQTALQVAGLKVDVEALPQALIDQITSGLINLADPANTIALVGLDAVVGVKGEVVGGQVVRVGVTCALCHSTVDNSLTGGIGHRLDGWPNRDLNVGLIISLTSVQDAPYNTWGPGMYDPRFNFHPNEPSVPVVLPPAFGLHNVAKETYTGDGPVSYWNAYVAITQMHGHGRFSDPRIGVNVDNTPPDLVSSKLDALRSYQLSLEAPEARAGTYDAAAAERGEKVFRKAGCADCHRGSTYTDINSGRLWDPAEVGQSDAYALRTATKQYRTTPLRGLWNPPQLDGPYFHDGSAATLEAVVEHYIDFFHLTLTTQQKKDLVEFLKTL
jgi:mono/diheme cytochrome c family protein